jgi:hypothetical protein
MSTVNRSLLIVRAKKPFLDWLHSLPDPGVVTLADVNRDSTVYLLPEIEYDAEQEGILKHFFDLIFEEQLMGWWQDDRDWPSNRSFEVFTDWFDVEFHSLVLDLVDEPLTSED